VDLNLDNLKTEILDYLNASEFALFRSVPGALDTMPLIEWDTESVPDYRIFLDAARKAKREIIFFSAREFEEDEITDATEELEALDLTRDERRDYERRIRDSKRHLGAVCYLELGFEYNTHFYVYGAQPDWYSEFLETCDEITSLSPDTNPFGEDPEALGGGFYSNN